MIVEELQKNLSAYQIRVMTKETILDAWEVTQSNPEFYQYINADMATVEDCLGDLTALPPGVTYSDKTYVGIYKEGRCIAVLDYYEGFPVKDSAYIGLLMIHGDMHAKGVARELFEAVCRISKEKQYQKLELGCFETNLPGLAFWEHLGFQRIGSSKLSFDENASAIIKLRYLIS